MGTGKFLIAASLFLSFVTGCSTPSYYSYKGKSESWDGEMEVKADETISEASITLKMAYKGKKIKDEKDLIFSVTLPDHSKAAYQTKFTSKNEAAVEHVFEHVKFPAEMEENYTVLIRMDEKEEKLSLNLQ